MRPWSPASSNSRPPWWRIPREQRPAPTSLSPGEGAGPGRQGPRSVRGRGPTPRGAGWVPETAGEESNQTTPTTASGSRHLQKQGPEPAARENPTVQVDTNRCQRELLARCRPPATGPPAVAATRDSSDAPPPGRPAGRRTARRDSRTGPAAGPCRPPAGPT